ncbi:MAG: desulfoferrodoxin [Candidatus Methanoplasma sp.]|jgi:superoxide reductase|nr:desulfoferrodoxin [Candidatus Methanoplasma sp.]
MGKTERKDIYLCAECGNAVEAVTSGSPVPVCCGKRMEKAAAKTGDFSTEKHVPYIERDGRIVKVRVGKEAAHPMTPEHYIVFIEIEADGAIMRRYLQPGDAPEARFETDAKDIVAREFCNLHKLWASGQ